MIRDSRIINLIQSLIRINSENPPGNEVAVARFIAGHLKKLGVTSRIYEFSDKRTNLIACIKGKGSHSLIVTPHLDTVPAGRNWENNPFEAKRIRGRIYGLGATDCKCNIACFIEALNSMLEKNIVLPYNLIFAATADEESGSGLGLLPLLEKKILRADAALVLDADDFDIIVAQKGLLQIKVSIKGRKAHGAYPQQGINAINIAAQFINEIRGYRFAYRRNRYLKRPTVNIGTIRGGDKVNIVPDWCVLELDFRFLPGEEYKGLLKLARGIIKKYTDNFNIEIKGLQAPYLISERHPLVSKLKKAFLSSGVIPRVTGSEGATVITFFKKYNIPAVATGFGVSGCAHIVDEYVEIRSLVKGASALENFFTTYRN